MTKKTDVVRVVKDLLYSNNFSLYLRNFDDPELALAILSYVTYKYSIYNDLFGYIEFSLNEFANYYGISKQNLLAPYNKQNKKFNPIEQTIHDLHTRLFTSEETIINVVNGKPVEYIRSSVLGNIPTIVENYEFPKKGRGYKNIYKVKINENYLRFLPRYYTLLLPKKILVYKKKNLLSLYIYFINMRDKLKHEKKEFDIISISEIGKLLGLKITLPKELKRKVLAKLPFIVEMFNGSFKWELHKKPNGSYFYYIKYSFDNSIFNTKELHLDSVNMAFKNALNTSIRATEKIFVEDLEFGTISKETLKLNRSLNKYLHEHNDILVYFLFLSDYLKEELLQKVYKETVPRFSLKSNRIKNILSFLTADIINELIKREGFKSDTSLEDLKTYFVKKLNNLP